MQVAPTKVNVADSLSFGDPMVAAFRKALPGGFYSKLTSPVNTMEHLKEGIKIGDKVVFDLESIFLRLLIVGQPIFGYEICAVPPSLVERLGVKHAQPQLPDYRSNRGCPTVDVSYHVIWPYGGTVDVLAESLNAPLAMCGPAEKILVFDRYDDVSAKDHERQRRAGVGSTTFNLERHSPLPTLDDVMKNKHNKHNLFSLLSTCNLGPQVSVESRDDGVFLHDEADVTIINYLFQAVDDGRQVVRILTDDSDIFVLLVFWTWRYGLQDKSWSFRWKSGMAFFLT